MEPRRTITLPDPCLVVLVGAAGAGKSTLAARLFPASAILSSDAYRGIVSGNEADQQATKRAFGLLDRELARRMAALRTTVIDATNVTRFARRGLVGRAAAHGVPAVAIVLSLPPEVVRARNSGRAGRVVPDLAVARQLAELGGSLAPGALESEGFAAIHLITETAELDGLEVLRLPADPRR